MDTLKLILIINTMAELRLFKPVDNIFFVVVIYVLFVTPFTKHWAVSLYRLKKLINMHR